MGFVIAVFVSRYFTVILSGFQLLFVIMGSSLYRGSLYCSRVPLYIILSGGTVDAN